MMSATRKPTELRSVVALVLLAAAGQSSAGQDGQQLFSSTCAACHGLDGRGGEHAPTIAIGSRAQGLSDVAFEDVVKKGVPAAGMPGFAKTFSPSQIANVMAYVRVLQQKPASSLEKSGDAAKGLALFLGAAHCSQCHLVNGQGGFLGADLSGYGKTHAAESIREWIVHPEKQSASSGRTVVAVDRSGVRYQGVIRNEDNFSLQVQTPDGVFHSFDKDQLTRVERPAESLMPSNYGVTLSRSEIDDLVSFLLK